MQRRAALEVSRRHHINWSHAVRPIQFSCRTFRSSCVAFNSSSGSSSPSGEGDDSPARRPLFSTPKFGSRFGGQSQSPSGLSAAEQAARNALLEKQAKERGEQQDVSRQTSRQGLEGQTSRDHQEPKLGWREPHPEFSRSPRSSMANRGTYGSRKPGNREEGQHIQGNNDGKRSFPQHRTDHRRTRYDAKQMRSKEPSENGANRTGHTSNADWSLQRGKGFNVNDQSIPHDLPRHLRAQDWPCPNCKYDCHGKHLHCPRCRTPRPGLVIDGKSVTGWTCPLCETVSDPNSHWCQKCRATNPHRRPKFRDWSCPKCQTYCLKRQNACPKCQTPKPGLTPGHQPASDATPVTTPGTLNEFILADFLKPTGENSAVAQTSKESGQSGEPSAKEAQKPSSTETEAGEHQPSLDTSQPLTQAWATSRYEGRPMTEQPSRTSTATLDNPVADRGLTESRSKSEKQLKFEDQSLNMERVQNAQTSKASKRRGKRKQHEVDSVREGSEEYDEQALGNIRQQRDTQTWKANKYREGRKQRESDIDDDFDQEEYRSRREQRKQMKREKARQKELDQGPSPLYLPAFISVSNLADVIGIRQAQFIRHMEDMGFEDVTHNHILDAETAGLVAAEFNFEPIFDTQDEDLAAAPEPEDKSAFPSRPPVVTIMGHVDHGKTTILDWLRHSSVAASEHGGITQHIGAFSVAMPSGKLITFLDTPGHEAFLDMRRRGADVTDIVVLVVAADDSVKPQTVEAIKHATSSKVPIIVAMSKVDKPGIDTGKVKQDLSTHGVYVEDYGGDVQAIGVSGKTGQGMLELEEAIITLSEVLDHRADDTGSVEGWVIEASTKSHGRVATVLIKRGTLRPGDIIVAGTAWTRVRTLRNEAGVQVQEATPGMPVEIDGWREQPSAGSEILQAPSEQKAKDVIEVRQEKSETEKLGEDTSAMNKARREVLERRRLEAAGGSEEADQEQFGPKKVNFIVKADVGGSAEAVMNSVTAVGNNEVYANVLRSAIGPVSEFDIEHAASSNGHLISFNQPIDPGITRMAEKRGVNIMDHNVIYKLIDDVKDALSEHLPPSVSHRVTGEAEISQIFEINIKRKEKTAIAGCKVRNGVINRSKKVRVLRNQDIIFDGTISSLKNVKKDVTEMRKDTECGMAFEGWADFEPGDHVQCYEEIHETRHL
ncbi:hypothetical protein PHISCL_01345 [Aspergillus sclerotialis]|uniref:Translation initiation factor IF-2, mitochondrial n=1 Tax=Aspergillus sclerotialis TaxID=2070753 RepID=A0A3A2ZT84_9EURO|nr:hypothetical protein PHISCL_01345 [Aspergillus sclerotialis]